MAEIQLKCKLKREGLQNRLGDPAVALPFDDCQGLLVRHKIANRTLIQKLIQRSGIWMKPYWQRHPEIKLVDTNHRPADELMSSRRAGSFRPITTDRE